MIKKFSIITAILFLSFTFASLVLGEVKEEEWTVCDEVVGGNILRLRDGRIILLIGIDMPELAQTDDDTSKEIVTNAIGFLKDKLKGKKIRIVYGAERTDFFGRARVYVYLENGEFINAEIIRKGYGFVDRISGFKHLKEFEEYEMKAQQEEKGIWKLMSA